MSISLLQWFEYECGGIFFFLFLGNGEGWHDHLSPFFINVLIMFIFLIFSYFEYNSTIYCSLISAAMSSLFGRRSTFPTTACLESQSGRVGFFSFARSSTCGILSAIAERVMISPVFVI